MPAITPTTARASHKVPLEVVGESRPCRRPALARVRKERGFAWLEADREADDSYGRVGDHRLTITLTVVTALVVTARILLVLIALVGVLLAVAVSVLVVSVIRAVTVGVVVLEIRAVVLLVGVVDAVAVSVFAAVGDAVVVAVGILRFVPTSCSFSLSTPSQSWSAWPSSTPSLFEIGVRRIRV